MRALLLLPVLLLSTERLAVAAPELSSEFTLGAVTQDPPADPKAEYEKRKKEAEGNVEKLWKLVDWCEAYGMKSEKRTTLRSILKLEPENRKAHEGLGHVEYEGKWYDSERKVEEYKKKNA